MHELHWHRDTNAGLLGVVVIFRTLIQEWLQVCANGVA